MTNILDLKEFNILQEFRNDEYKYMKFVVEPKEEAFFCTRCGCSYDLDGTLDGKKFKKHDTRIRTVRDLDIRGYKVILEINQRRYDCPECGETFTEFLESVAPDDKVTERLWDTMGLESVKGKNSFSSVAEKYGVSVSTVKRAFDDNVKELYSNRVLVAPKVLGIDEVYIKLEGHKRKVPCAVFTDIENHKILEFVLGNSIDIVENVIKSMQGYQNIKAVTMDMNATYKNAVNELLPQTYTVVDRFHVIQKFNMKLDVIRAKIQAKLTNSKIIEDDDYEELATGNTPKDLLFRVKDLIRKNREDLDNKAIKKLDTQLELYPKLKESYWLKEKFRTIYQANDKKEAYGKYFEWEQSIPKNNREFKALQKTINGLKHEIFAYFDGKYTNAYTESFNNVIKTIVKLGKGYGYETLRAKVLFGTEATKKIKVKDMNFYKVFNMMERQSEPLWSYNENEYYTDETRYADFYTVDIPTLSHLIDTGEF